MVLFAGRFLQKGPVQVGAWGTLMYNSTRHSNYICLPLFLQLFNKPQQNMHRPLEDSQQDAVLVAAEKVRISVIKVSCRLTGLTLALAHVNQINGETRIVWERKLTTGDANDIAIDPNKSLLFMHALGFSSDVRNSFYLIRKLKVLAKAWLHTQQSGSCLGQ